MNTISQASSVLHTRIIYLDLLRIISAFAVIFLHVSAQHWNESFFSTEWMIRNFYDSCVRWCVPVFVMISGALFLDSSKELNIKQLYKKNVVHILWAFISWSIIYAIANAVFVNKNEEIKMSYIVSDIIAGRFHLWFLKMILGLYIVIPILKAIVSNKPIEKYFICIAVVTAFMLPVLFFYIGHLNIMAKDIVVGWYNTIDIKIALGYTGYFVLGHFLNTYYLNTKTQKTVYVLGCLSCICVILSTYLFSMQKGKAESFFYDYLNIFTLFEAMAIFLLVKQKSSSIPTKFHTYIIHLSKMSFGIYLVHILVLVDIMYIMLGFNSSTFNPLFFIPCLSLIVFFVSYIITWILYHIPYLNKLVA